MPKQLKLDPSIYEAMQKERVEVGDVIYIEANSGAVKRTGRSDAFATEFDLEVIEFVLIHRSLSLIGFVNLIFKTPNCGNTCSHKMHKHAISSSVK